MNGYNMNQRIRKHILVLLFLQVTKMKVNLFLNQLLAVVNTWELCLGALGLEIWTSEDGDKNLRYELANHYEVLFKIDQKRSFDLKNKP